MRQKSRSRNISRSILEQTLPLRIRQVIENSPLFSGLDSGLLDDVASSVSKRTLRAHELLFQKGDRSDALWGVLSGRIVTEARAEDGKEMVLDVYQPGDIFGEVGVLDFGPRRVEATAACHSELFRLERSRFLEFLQANPELCFRVFSLLCTHLRDTTETLEDMALYKMPDRLAKLLIRMTDAAVVKHGGRVLHVTQFDLARAMGVQREAVNRQLKEWEKSGWIAVKRQKIEVLDEKSLGIVAAPRRTVDFRNWGNDHPSALPPAVSRSDAGSPQKPGRSEERSVAILAIDCSEYAQFLMSDSETAIKRIRTGLAAIDSAVRDHDGKVIWSAGERTLAEFPVVSDALEAALQIQKNAGEAGQDTVARGGPIFRFGIHFGKVLASEGRLVGDPVNVAIHLTELPGSSGICFTHEVRDGLKDPGNLEFQYLGKHDMKNAASPVGVFSVQPVPWPKKIVLWADALVPRRYRPLVLASFLLLLMVGVWSLGDRVGVPGSLPGASRMSIAVLPFVDLSGDQGGVPFSDGMHSELLTKLARLEAVKVISRNSVLGYRGTGKDPRTIGKELDVETIMEGEVQRSADRLHVNIQLIDAKTNQHIWAETYDRELTATNVFAIQTEIAREVAKTFQLELSPKQQALLSELPTTNMAAYESYLMGHHLMAKRTTADIAEAVDYFQKATVFDADYALAYVGLADAYAILEWYGDEPSEELMAKSRSAVDHALELDDSLGEAYASLASLVFADYEQAEAAYRRSIELSPNYATAHHWYGTLLRLHGRLEEAGQQFGKARELDPLSAIINAEIGTYQEELGHFDESRKQLEKVVSIDPGFRDIYRDLAALSGTAYGRTDEALALLQKELATSRSGVPEDPGSLAWLYVNIAHAYMQLGGDDQALFWIRAALDLVPEHVGALFALQELRLLNGETYRGRDYPWELLEKMRILEDYNLLPIQDALRLRQYHDLLEGRDVQYLVSNARNDPEALQRDNPKLTRRNFHEAILLALTLAGTGEQEQAEQLLEDSLQEFKTMPRLGRYGFQIADVIIYTIQGKKEQALAALRTAIDDGWRYRARYLLELEPNLLSLHSEPRYQAMLAEVKGDLADQFERVQEMERKGQLTLAPGLTQR